MKEHNFNQRILAPLKGRKIPRHMLFTDTETHPEYSGEGEVQKFTLGWLFYWDSTTDQDSKCVTEEYFDNAAAYCKRIGDIVHEVKSVTIYGHNIFFDLQCAGFFEYFTAQGWALDWIYDKGLTYILRIRQKKKIIMALSTTNYFTCPLKELGHMIGLEKGDIDLDRCTRLQLKKYCHRDTEIVLRGVWHYIDFVKDNDLGSMAVTKSSQAFKAYRTRFMDKKICLHDDDRVFDLEREAYMGGRTEAFYIGRPEGDDFVILDINGMYPFVMRKYQYPSMMVCYMEGEKRGSYTRWLGSYGMIAEVDIDTPEPAFGVRYRKKLIFPTGCFRAFLCTEGLRYAVKKGYVKNIIRASLYQMEDLFSGYVDYFSDLRKKYADENNEVMAKLCKYMHNSLYGKWGQRDLLIDMTEDNSGEPYLHREIWDSVYGGWWSETHLMNKIIMTHPGGEGPHSFPGLAAHITENARLELWGIIKLIGAKRVLYCDTDGVIIKASDLDKVTGKLSGSTLGDLKIQGRYSGLEIGGVKNYRAGGERHIKGIPESAREVSPGVFTYDSFQRQSACLDDARLTGVRIIPVTRRLTHSYDKGLLQADGSVKPYHFAFFDPVK